MSILPAPPFKRMTSMNIPTGPTDAYSFRDLYLVQPTTPHSHNFRGDEGFGGLSHCTGNGSYGGPPNDQHEMRGFTLGNTTFGEFHQQEKLFDTVWSDLPPNPPGTLQAFEIKLEWLYRNYSPDLAGTPQWTWGVGWDYMNNSSVPTIFHTFVLQLDLSYSSTLMRARTGWAISGNRFRAVSAFAFTPAVMLLNSSPPDVRLQVILRCREYDINPAHYAIYQDYWVSVDEGASWLNCGQVAIDQGTTAANLLDRLHSLYLGSGWDQGINGTVYQTTRNWNAYTYLWNPIGGSVFAWAGRSHSQLHRTGKAA